MVAAQKLRDALMRESTTFIRKIPGRLYWYSTRRFLVGTRVLRDICLYWLYRFSSKKLRFAITQPYGRAGNNIQQMLVAISHAEAFHGVVNVDEDFLSSCRLSGLIRPFTLDFGDPDHSIGGVIRRRFFHFTEYAFDARDFSRMHFRTELRPRRDCLLSRQHMEANLWRIAQSHLLPNVIGSSFHSPPLSEHLVLHLRAGDVGSLCHDYYIPNPLCFYRWLRQFHDSLLIVMEPGEQHFMVQEITSLFRAVEVLSGSVIEDFQRLRSAKYLASSGVSTFPMAASLLSSCLDTYYCSSLFLVEHLNPRMLMGTSVHLETFNLPDFQKLWLRSTDRRDLLIQYEPSRSFRSSPAH
jgi:hypothetical protein